jgi:hypothetical protein
MKLPQYAAGKNTIAEGERLPPLSAVKVLIVAAAECALQQIDVLRAVGGIDD